MHRIAELGCDAALEKQLLRVRQEIYGPTPKSRLHFDPNIFLENIYENKNTVTVMDSDELDGDWNSKIARKNTNSEYSWDRLTNDIRDIENLYHEESDEIDTPEEEDPETERAFSSLKLLKHLSRGLKSSVDGTFKSSCNLWKQHFI